MDEPTPIDVDPEVEAYALMALDAAIYGSPHPPWLYFGFRRPVHEQIDDYLAGLEGRV